MTLHKVITKGRTLFLETWGNPKPSIHKQNIDFDFISWWSKVVLAQV